MLEKIGQGAGGPEITRHVLVFTYQKGTGMDGCRFHVLCIDAVITDQRIGHGHQLANIRGISQHLLVAAHAGIKDNLTHRLTVAGKTAATQDRPVFKPDQCFHIFFCLKFFPSGNGAKRQILRSTTQHACWNSLRRILPATQGRRGGFSRLVEGLPDKMALCQGE